MENDISNLIETFDKVKSDYKTLSNNKIIINNELDNSNIDINDNIIVDNKKELTYNKNMITNNNLLDEEVKKINVTCIINGKKLDIESNKNIKKEKNITNNQYTDRCIKSDLM